MPFTTMSLPRADGVSFVVPVRNGARGCRACSPAHPRAGRRRAHRSRRRRRRQRRRPARHPGPRFGRRLAACDRAPATGRGAAAAINAGVRAARYPIICQVDQDVVARAGLAGGAARRALDDPTVAAAQGYYVTDPAAPLSARVMGLDLEQRYADRRRRHGPRLHRQRALSRRRAARIGRFDESLRLRLRQRHELSAAARPAYRLVSAATRAAPHQWREGLLGVSSSAVWIRLRTPRPRRATHAAGRRRCGVARADDAASRRAGRRPAIACAGVTFGRRRGGRRRPCCWSAC